METFGIHAQMYAPKPKSTAATAPIALVNLVEPALTPSTYPSPGNSGASKPLKRLGTAADRSGVI
jgi:hypothetical protein